jgi:glycosyltransferase involved in cell wall biosynthesis
MRIAIDARWINPEISGIGEYTREIIKHLAAIDKSNTYTILFSDAALRDRTVAETGLADANNFATHVVPYGLFSIRNQFLLPRLLRKLDVDVFHSPYFMIPFLAFPKRKQGTVRCVVTIHDVIPMLFRTGAPRSLKERFFPLYRQLMLEVGRRADALITVSNASRKDMVAQMELASDADIKVIHNGVSEMFQPPAQPITREASDVRRVLYVGRSDPYKNVSVLVQAFADVRAACQFPVELSVVGPRDPRYPEAEQLAQELGIADAATWLGYLSDADLVRTYQESDILVYPSSYEGFGLQVLEAMACGTPVVCTTGGALPEVAGEAAIVVPPGDATALAEKMKLVLTDKAVADDLSTKGRGRAAKFSWDTAARDTLSVFERVARSK